MVPFTKGSLLFKVNEKLIFAFLISYLLLQTYFKIIKPNLLTLYSLWIGSVANQIFHPVMFDKCIQILKKSWPQESNLSRKRKKEQPKSYQSNSRGCRKRGKPPRKEDIEVRSKWNNKTYLPTCDFDLRINFILKHGFRHNNCNQKVLKYHQLSSRISCLLGLPILLRVRFCLAIFPNFPSSLPSFVLRCAWQHANRYICHIILLSLEKVVEVSWGLRFIRI